ncbi:hypothetical protein GOP47_0019142 [Adiantum capillus-veneris]|uniref:Uncharacterized protein n=1 Tax=Adiantum capillus-veneris TaxID=13818 RepID=A0A9D4Z8T5_ADICA|nr:hypothetical protein GOP47_0019142 [Adiantum capillus-veneris]
MCAPFLSYAIVQSSSDFNVGQCIPSVSQLEDISKPCVEIKKNDEGNTLRYYRRHKVAINRIQDMYKKGLSPFNKFVAPKVDKTRVLKARKEDVTDVSNLKDE